MLTRWFQSFARRAFLANIEEFDAAISKETARIKALRRQLLGLYNEIEFAMGALDVLVERADLARLQVRDRMTRPDVPSPAVFSRDVRQRPGSGDKE